MLKPLARRRAGRAEGGTEAAELAAEVEGVSRPPTATVARADGDGGASRCGEAEGDEGAAGCGEGVGAGKREPVTGDGGKGAMTSGEGGGPEGGGGRVGGLAAGDAGGCRP